MPIRILPDHVVAQIAAGEVIERPASVVKELVENALDAGASNVHVSCTDGGRRLIRVSDDGSGILVDEVGTAFSQHATSKLERAEDLEAIRTLGFRGEALASIASVSQVSLVTRHRDEQTGTEFRVAGAIPGGSQPVGAPAGTVITVENLFFNTPARLKFLKKVNTEKRYISALVTRYAMAYPDVRFTLEQDGRELFRTTGTGSLADVIVRTMGLDSFRQMIEVGAENARQGNRPAVRVTGYTSLPDFNRSDRSQITLFVNGRWIQDSSLAYAVIQAYQSRIPSGRYPHAVILIELPPNEVDVNVHPAKAEVRFRDQDAVFATVQRAVREGLIAQEGVRLGPDSQHQRDTSGPARASLWGGASQSGWQQRSMDLGEPQVSVPSRRMSRADEIDHDADLSGIPEGAGVPERPRTLPPLRIVGQVGAMYIIAEGPAGLYLIDQHAAHARVMYQELVDLVEAGSQPPVATLEGQTIQLSGPLVNVLEATLHIFEALGFVIEPFGPGTYVVRGMPQMLGEADARIVSQLVEVLHGAGNEEPAAVLLRQVSQAAAVRAGAILDQATMQDVVRRLERTPEPLTAPDGRPTLIHLSGEQLAREFGR
jgi:DNA mismatch repair protein MutL